MEPAEFLDYVKGKIDERIRNRTLHTDRAHPKPRMRVINGERECFTGVAYDVRYEWLLWITARNEMLPITPLWGVQHTLLPCHELLELPRDVNRLTEPLHIDEGLVGYFGIRPEVLLQTKDFRSVDSIRMGGWMLNAHEGSLIEAVIAKALDEIPAQWVRERRKTDEYCRTGRRTR